MQSVAIRKDERPLGLSLGLTVIVLQGLNGPGLWARPVVLVMRR